MSPPSDLQWSTMARAPLRPNKKECRRGVGLHRGLFRPRLAWLSALAAIVLGLARSAWLLWQTQAKPTADPRAGLLLADLFGEVLPALKAS